MAPGVSSSFYSDPKRYSLAATLVTHDATLTPHAVRQQLLGHEEIVHSSLEIHVCENHHD